MIRKRRPFFVPLENKNLREHYYNPMLQLSVWKYASKSKCDFWEDFFFFNFKVSTTSSWLKEPRRSCKGKILSIVFCLSSDFVAISYDLTSSVEYLSTGNGFTAWQSVCTVCGRTPRDSGPSANIKGTALLVLIILQAFFIYISGGKFVKCF